MKRVFLNKVNIFRLFNESLAIVGHNILDERQNCVLDMYVTMCGLIPLKVLPALH